MPKKIFSYLITFSLFFTFSISIVSAQVFSEWTQHAFNAERTSFNPTSVATPWSWKWSWNGPDANGNIVSNKTSLPRNVQPITGNGKVYVASGSNGVYALDSNNGLVVWNSRPGGNFNSTLAYDYDTNSVYAVASNGYLYKLNANTGAVESTFIASQSSFYSLPVAIHLNNVYFSMGSNLYALNKSDLSLIWNYSANSNLQTPPSVSPSKNVVIVGSADLHVHAVNTSDGSQKWRVKPTVRNQGAVDTEMTWGWPVIAEQNGYVLIKYRLDWQTLWTWSPWPSSNASIRSNLQSNPSQQALFVLDLNTGLVPFVANIGHGGYGNGGYMPMGFQPVIKNVNGEEVAYVVMRGSPCKQNPCDGRWDSHLGEMLLDNNTNSNFQAGDVRFMQNCQVPDNSRTLSTTFCLN